MPTYAEDRLVSNVATVLATISNTVTADTDRGGMIRTANPAALLGTLLKMAGMGELAKMIPQLGVGTVALMAYPYVGLRRFRDLIKRETGVDPEAGIPLPYRDIRREGPRSDDKWWDRDRPTKIGEVPPSFYLETPDYEKWYLDQQARGRAEYGRDIGIPATFQTLPGYLFKPKVSPTYPVLPSSNAFDMYDAESSGLPIAAGEGHGRTVVAQQGAFGTSQRAAPAVPGNHPFANMITPEDAESAASMGAYEGWYSPATKESPFLDPTFAAHGPAEWQPGRTPMETNIRRQQALQQQTAQRAGQAMNWRVGQILASLRGGVITQEQAAQNIWMMIDMMEAQGIPRETAQQSLMSVLQAVQSGQAGGLPERMVGGMDIPDPLTQESWEGLGTPTGSPMRNQMLQNIDMQAERMRGLAPGFGSPLEGYTVGGGTMF